MQTARVVRIVESKVSLMILVAAACMLGMFLSTVKVHAAPATFTVTNTDDSGIGSLRQAIEDANNNENVADMDVIEFDISGSQVHRIVLESSLPNITQKVTIDGYSQNGASQNTTISPQPMDSVIKIEIDANSETDTALYFESGSEESVLSGISIFGASQNLVSINADNVQISGNYVGTDSTGLVNPSAVYDGVQTGLSIKGDNDSLGGLLASDRNIVTNSATIESSGAVVVEANSVNVFGNYIGIGRDGITDLGAIQGIILQSSSGIVIGGTAVGATNVISGSSVVQVTVLGSTGAVVQGNLVGTDYLGETNEAISNGTGISIVFMSEGNLIGVTI